MYEIPKYESYEEIQRAVGVCRFTWPIYLGCSHWKDWLKRYRPHICVLRGQHREHQCVCGALYQ